MIDFSNTGETPVPLDFFREMLARRTLMMHVVERSKKT